MTEPRAEAPAGPYAAAAELYRARGWAGVLPVVGKSSHLPAGFTGYAGRWPTDAEVAGWVAERGGDNLALRVPGDVIGIDVDAYDGRRGLETLTWWESDEQCGPLSPTWTSTSRSDGSGIRLFRVPGGRTWKHELERGGNVDVIQLTHRYFVAWPSVHPDTSRAYRWHDESGAERAGPPAPADLAELPDRWAAALRRDERMRPDGGSHGEEDEPALDHEGERVSPDRLLLEGAPAGEQQAELFRYLCSLRARGAHEQEMITLGIAVTQRFENARPDEPWTIDDVIGLVRRVRGSYAPGRSVPELTETQREFARRLAAGDAPRAEEILEHRPAENATDTGNAELFVRVFGGDLRYVPKLGWLHWDSRRWARDEGNRALDLTGRLPDLLRETHGDDRAWIRWAHTSEAAARREAVLRLAAAHPSVVASADGFDADPDLLVVRNGTLDLRSGELRESRRGDLCTQLAEVSHDPAATSSNWETAVRAITGYDNAAYRYVQRALGYSLTGHVTERKFFFLHGDGFNGKNTLVEPVMKLLGTYAVQSNAKLFGGGGEHDTIVASLLGRRLVFVDELPDRRGMNVERLKNLTGSAQIRAHFMRQDEFTFTNQVKLWLTCNGDPPITDDSRAVWDRMHRITCPTRFGESGLPLIRGYGELLYRDEAPGILNWLIDGLRAYRSEGLNPPAAVLDAVEEYRSEEQHLERWVTETLSRVDAPDPEMYFLSNASLRGSWELWAAANGVPKTYRDGVTPHRLGHVLRRRGFARHVAKRGGLTVRGWRGIAHLSDLRGGGA